MSLSRLARRNPLPELADGWEGSARGRQTSRRTGGQVGDQLQGLDFPLAPWGFCSPSEQPHDISYAVSSPLIRCTAQEKLLGQRCSGARRGIGTLGSDLRGKAGSTKRAVLTPSPPAPVLDIHIFPAQQQYKELRTDIIQA